VRIKVNARLSQDPGALYSKSFAWSEAEGIEDAVSGDGDYLAAFDVEGYGIGANGTAGLEVPQWSAGTRVERVKVAFI
jgi:hypothetical protein